jgi:ABC-type multidrug transport system permease subunit
MLKYIIMISNNLTLFNWDWGIYGAVFMLLVFLGLIFASYYLFVVEKTILKKINTIITS